MAAFKDLSYSEHLESSEKLEGPFCKLCKTNNQYDYPSSSRNPLTTFDAQSLHSIVEGFVNYNFTFPNYGEKVERVGLNKLLYSKSPGRHTYNNPNISLCSMVQNDDLKNYMREFERKMSSIPTNPSHHQIKRPAPEAVTENKTDAGKTRHPSKNGSVYTVSDMSISSLSDVDDIIVDHHLRNGEENESIPGQNTPTENEVTVSNQVPFLPNVQNYISEHNITSDKPVEKNTDIDESEKSEAIPLNQTNKLSDQNRAKDDIIDTIGASVCQKEEENRKDRLGVVSNGRSPPDKCGKEIISGDETLKQAATENAAKYKKGTTSTSGEDSDVLVLNVNDTDNITEHSVTDDEKITNDKSLPLKEKDNLKGKSEHHRSSLKKIKSSKQSPPTVQSSTGFNKNQPEKENKLKNEKPKYAIEDPLEMDDINDPEWEQISRLKTDEERYKAVKNCWGSDKIPNPNRDLTRHCFRWRRLRKEGYTSTDNTIIKRKRTATRQPEGTLDSKRQKIETVPCTLILDRKIELEKKLYNQKLSQEESIYHTSVHKAMYTIERDIKILEEEYRRKISQGHSSLNVNNPMINTDLVKWKDHRERCISEKKERELQLAGRRLAEARRRIENNHAETLNKLNSARREVLKFNQFYCGLNNLDPTVIEGRRIQEATKAEQMYEFYQKIYAPSRL